MGSDPFWITQSSEHDLLAFFCSNSCFIFVFINPFTYKAKSLIGEGHSLEEEETQKDKNVKLTNQGVLENNALPPGGSR